MILYASFLVQKTEPCISQMPTEQIFPSTMTETGIRTKKEDDTKCWEVYLFRPEVLYQGVAAQ